MLLTTAARFMAPKPSDSLFCDMYKEIATHRTNNKEFWMAALGALVGAVTVSSVYCGFWPWLVRSLRGRPETFYSEVVRAPHTYTQPKVGLIKHNDLWFVRRSIEDKWLEVRPVEVRIGEAGEFNGFPKWELTPNGKVLSANESMLAGSTPIRNVEDLVEIPNYVVASGVFDEGQAGVLGTIKPNALNIRMGRHLISAMHAYTEQGKIGWANAHRMTLWGKANIKVTVNLHEHQWTNMLPAGYTKSPSNSGYDLIAIELPDAVWSKLGVKSASFNDISRSCAGPVSVFGIPTGPWSVSQGVLVKSDRDVKDGIQGYTASTVETFSGSPVTQRVNGKDKIVALHICGAKPGEHTNWGVSGPVLRTFLRKLGYGHGGGLSKFLPEPPAAEEPKPLRTHNESKSWKFHGAGDSYSALQQEDWEDLYEEEKEQQRAEEEAERFRIQNEMDSDLMWAQRAHDQAEGDEREQETINHRLYGNTSSHSGIRGVDSAETRKSEPKAGAFKTIKTPAKVDPSKFRMPAWSESRSCTEEEWHEYRQFMLDAVLSGKVTFAAFGLTEESFAAMTFPPPRPQRKVKFTETPVPVVPEDEPFLVPPTDNESASSPLLSRITRLWEAKVVPNEEKHDLGFRMHSETEVVRVAPALVFGPKVPDAAHDAAHQSRRERAAAKASLPSAKEKFVPPQFSGFSTNQASSSLGVPTPEQEAARIAYFQRAKTPETTKAEKLVAQAAIARARFEATNRQTVTGAVTALRKAETVVGDGTIYFGDPVAKPRVTGPDFAAHAEAVISGKYFTRRGKFSSDGTKLWHDRIPENLKARGPRPQSEIFHKGGSRALGLPGAMTVEHGGNFMSESDIRASFSRVCQNFDNLAEFQGTDFSTVFDSDWFGLYRSYITAGQIDVISNEELLEQSHFDYMNNDSGENMFIRRARCARFVPKTDPEKDVPVHLSPEVREAMGAMNCNFTKQYFNPPQTPRVSETSLRNQSKGLRATNMDTCTVTEQVMMQWFDEYPESLMTARELGPDTALERIYDGWDPSKSAGYASVYVPGTKANWIKDPDMRATLSYLIVCRLILRIIAGAAMSTMTPMEMVLHGLSDPKVAFTKIEATDKVGRERQILMLTPVDAGCQEVVHKDQNKADIAAYHSGELKTQTIGLGHHDDGIKQFGKILSFLGEISDRVFNSDASGYDLSVPRDKIMIDAERRVHCCASRDKNYIFRELLLLEGYATSAHVFVIGHDMWESQRYGMTASGTPSTSAQNSSGRTLEARAAGATYAPSLGDDLVNTGRMSLHALRTWGVVIKGDEKSAPPQGPHEYTSHSWVRQADGSWTAKFLNFQKLVANCDFRRAPGCAPEREVLNGCLFAIRHDEESVAIFRGVCERLGWPSPVLPGVADLGLLA